jgi:hypothetical protein
VSGGYKQNGIKECINMASKRKSTKKHDPRQIVVTGRSEEEKADAIARTLIRPTVQAAATLQELGGSSWDLDVMALINSLHEQTEAVCNNDLGRAEAMLTAQAHTLDAIFNNLARRAALNMGEYMQACETYLKLALRAQSQCRATWEALATIKNPPVAGYVRQANIAHGPQQVNNASAAPDGAPRAGENPNLQNKLLEEKDGERLDTGKTGTASEADPTMATLGEVDGSEDRGR